MYPEEEPEIFKRMKSGETIYRNEPDFEILNKQYRRSLEMMKRVNSLTDYDEIRNVLREWTGRKVPDSSFVIPPFYSEWGLFLEIGERVFVNSNAHLFDQGGIKLCDGVKLGPDVKIMTSNHPLDPKHRADIVNKPVLVKENAWIGAGSIILPGVTIGKNSVVGAGSVVTKDVPDDTVVVGNPARVVKQLEFD